MHQCIFYLNKKIELLDNKERILQYIQENPGLTQAQITHRLDVPQSTVKYHLITLEKENKIFSEKLFKIQYFSNEINEELKIKSCVENNFNLKIIIQSCKEEKTLDEIAKICNVSKSIASKRLKILESLNAIKKTKVEKKIKFCAN